MGIVPRAGGNVIPKLPSEKGGLSWGGAKFPAGHGGLDARGKSFEKGSLHLLLKLET